MKSLNRILFCQFPVIDLFSEIRFFTEYEFFTEGRLNRDRFYITNNTVLKFDMISILRLTSGVGYTVVPFPSRCKKVSYNLVRNNVLYVFDRDYGCCFSFENF
jgi:hypothetical protein